MSVFGFKAFNSDFTCRGFRYEIGKTYEIEGKPILCENGFHFCKKLKDCFRFYEYEQGTRLAVVEAFGEVIDGRHKSATNKIKIVKEIPFDDVQNIIKSDTNKLFDVENGILKDCFKFVEGHIEIQRGITNINSSAFSHCRNLTSVTIPNSVTTIGDIAFYHCTSIETICIPDSVENMGIYMFDGCDNLKSIILPNNITSINAGTFYNCINLKELLIPNCVDTIYRYAFFNCVNLESIEIPNSVTDIQQCAFYHCIRMRCVTIPDSVIHIGINAFYRCNNLTDITILNNDCHICINSHTIPINAVIHGYKGSTAESYAEMFGRKFIPID